MFLKDDIAAQLWQPETDAAIFAVAGTLNGILGHSIFRAILHPCNPVPVRIVDLHSWPRGEDDSQVAR